MRIGFHNASDDCQWLRTTHLKGVPLPTRYATFASYILQGNEDAPYAVNLYISADPLVTDDYLRIRFQGAEDRDMSPLSYCEYQEYNGRTDKPY